MLLEVEQEEEVLSGHYYRLLLPPMCSETLNVIGFVQLLQDHEPQKSKLKITLVVMNVKNVFFKSALKTFYSYFSVLNDKNV